MFEGKSCSHFRSFTTPRAVMSRKNEKILVNQPFSSLFSPKHANLQGIDGRSQMESGFLNQQIPPAHSSRRLLTLRAYYQFLFLCDRLHFPFVEAIIV